MRIEDAVTRWVQWVARHALLVLTVIGAITVAAGFIAYDRFRMNSELGDLIDQTAPWRADFDRFEAAFPDLVNTLVVVVSGESLHAVENSAKAIEAGMRARSETFRAVYSPQVDPFFREHALLYLDEQDLDDTVDRLAEAQPMLTAVAEDPSLRSVLGLIRDAVENEPPSGLATVLEHLIDSAEAVIAGQNARVIWTDEFFDSDETLHRLVFAKGRQNYGEPLPNGPVVAAARQVIASLGDELAGVEVRVTGEVALEHEEIEAAVSGAQLAGWFSVTLLLLILGIGVRSVKIIAATFAMLVIGVVWTSAFAMLTVGEYNTLSIVFLVMFFGLGVDFSLHFSLRYQEAVNGPHGDVTQSLATSSRSVGRAIVICTITTAIGFLGFWPTEYKGLADLGVISAGGMLTASLLTFTFLPAFYAAVGEISPHSMDLPSSERLVGFLIRHREMVVGTLILLALAAGVTASKAAFDYSVLALRDPASESMRTLRVLQAENIANDYALTVLSDSPLDGGELEDLEVVDSVVSPADYVPKNQTAKLDVLLDLQDILWNLQDATDPRAPPTAAELRREITDTLELLERQGSGSGEAAAVDPLIGDELARLRTSLLSMQDHADTALFAWQHAMLDNLSEELEWLRGAMAVGEVTFADLPGPLQSRLRSADGAYLSMVLPAADLSDVRNLSRFVTEVRDHVPVATGRSVIEWGVGRIVIDSFVMALAIAAIGILTVLLVAFRRVWDGLLILTPLALAALFTLAAGVLMDQPLNMANVLVLPLIFGLGVDNGIHVVDRYRGERGVDDLIHSSTPRAVLLSTLTTIGTFAALSLSPHRGTASIGLLLTIAVGLLLVLTIFVLPVLLSFLDERRGITQTGRVVQS